MSHYVPQKKSYPELKYEIENNIPLFGVYYINTIPTPIEITTNVDFSKATIYIDDRNSERNNNYTYLFDIPATPSPTSIQKSVDENRIEYIRFGDNANSGVPHHRIWLPHEPITEPYTFIEKIPYNETPLTINGGIFITIANNEPSVVKYYFRGLHIGRSNVRIQNLTHFIENEGPSGAPYAGFIIADGCANLILENLILQGHHTYYRNAGPNEIIGTPMGSYELQINNCINTVLRNITQTNFDDRFAWGLLATSGCRDFTVDGCAINRFDVHQGIEGNLSITNSRIGYQGIKLIGEGTTTISNCLLESQCLIVLRPDFGSTYRGSIYIKDCRWYPKDKINNYIVACRNYGIHNFGYECVGPTIYLDNLQTSVKELLIQDPETESNLYPYTKPSLTI